MRGYRTPVWMRFLRYFGLARDPRPQRQLSRVAMLRVLAPGIAVIAASTLDRAWWVELLVVLAVLVPLSAGLIALERRGRHDRAA